MDSGFVGSGLMVPLCSLGFVGWFLLLGPGEPDIMNNKEV